MNTIIFKIYKINENNETIHDKDYSFNIDEKLSDIKKLILKAIFVCFTFIFIILESILIF